MWTVIKFDKKYFNLFTKGLKEKIGNDFIIYRPKVLVQNYKKEKLFEKEVDILGDYLFCFHKTFNEKQIINNLKYTKGLKYFLDGYNEFQNDIRVFINKCKKLEDQKGFISQNIFELDINKKYKFASGPFIEKIFKIVNLEKNSVNILIGNFKTKINKKKFLFNPV